MLKEPEKMLENVGIPKQEDFSERQNQTGFFDLLLKIDMRNNPELYKKKVNENYDDNGNTNYPHKA